MLRRKKEAEILEYLNKPDQALLVSGARQTGKTYLIREMCRRSGKTFLEFNLIEQPAVAAALQHAGNAKEVLMRLSLLADGPMIPGKTIIFLDEIQEAGDIVTLIKFLVDDGSYQYVLSGSLLGIELKGIRSAPVGYLHPVELFPLDFMEFLWAVGVQETVTDQLRGNFESRTAVDDYVHNRLMELYHLYLIIGGMPQAVQRYVDTNDLKQVNDVQKDIVRLYKRDFTKYEEKDKLKLISIYDLIPSELNKHNKRFVFTYLNKELKFDRYENSFLWLKDAGVALPVYNVSEPRLPLEQSKASNLFKLFMNDVGLLNSFYSTDVKLKILNRDGSVNNGALYENAVAQQLAANELPLFYLNSKNLGEVDFITEWNGECLPVEVKSGNDYTLHPALNRLLNLPGSNISQAIVFCKGNIQQYDRLLYVPIYLSMFLKNRDMESVLIPINLAGLT